MVVALLRPPLLLLLLFKGSFTPDDEVRCGAALRRASCCAVLSTATCRDT